MSRTLPSRILPAGGTQTALLAAAAIMAALPGWAAAALHATASTPRRSIGIDGADAGAHALGYRKSRQIPRTRAKNHDLLIIIFTIILN
jgi:hypothetical protein